jgi:hypothetical protein
MKKAMGGFPMAFDKRFRVTGGIPLPTAHLASERENRRADLSRLPPPGQIDSVFSSIHHPASPFLARRVTQGEGECQAKNDDTRIMMISVIHVRQQTLVPSVPEVREEVIKKP